MNPFMDLGEAAVALKKFGGANLTLTLAKIESSMCGVSSEGCTAAIKTIGAGEKALAAAGMLKAVAAPINVVIHTPGILLCLPHILDRDELRQGVSLGAGKTGRAHDREMTHRIGEFKFIQWRGGSESIRHSSIFKDYFLLAESTRPKRKYLYAIGTDYPLKFFNGGRSLASVLSKGDHLKTQFAGTFGGHFKTVCDYYAAHKDAVVNEDVSKFLSSLLPADGRPDDEIGWLAQLLAA